MKNILNDKQLSELKKIISEIRDEKDIMLSDIPCIDLYMDQVTTLFDDKLSNQKRFLKDTILTKTMINNYAKAKILPPIKNKKYTKQQIILLILIYNLKQILSLEDIKSLFAPILTSYSGNTSLLESIDDLYEQFQESKAFQQNSLLDEFIKYLDDSEVISKTDNDDITQLMMLVLTLVAGANLQKRLAEKIIDKYFKNFEI